MKKHIYLISSALMFSSMQLLAQDAQTIFYHGAATDYKNSDFAMWSSDRENYAYTADDWLGLYADKEGDSTWQRIIPDVRSIADGAPWCSWQTYESSEGILKTHNQHIECKRFLAESKRDGVIAKGTKGLLIDLEGKHLFIPLLQKQILAGKYPDISRTDIRLQMANLVPDQTSLRDKRIMLNEIYARYGYRFRPGGDMDTYFRAQPWYQPLYDNVDSFLTDVEKDNTQYLRALLAPDVEQKKAQYLQQATAYCQALKNNDLNYIKSISEALTTGADQSVSWNDFKEKMPAFRQLMLKGYGNCNRDIEEFVSYHSFYQEYSGIYNNVEFDYDRQQQKYLPLYVDFDDKCVAENSMVDIIGSLINKQYLDISQGEDQNQLFNVLVLRTVELPSCITGVNTDDPEWDRYVQLVLKPQDKKKFEALVGQTITLHGSLSLAVGPGHHTPVLLNSVELKLVEPKK